MSLQPISEDAIREANGFMFLMRVQETAQTVRVFVTDDALDGHDDQADARQLRCQFDADRGAFEAVACEKYDHGRVTPDGVIVIAFSDVIGFFA